MINFRFSTVFVIAAAIMVIAPFSSCNNSGNTPDLMSELIGSDVGKYIDSVPYSSHAPYPSDTSWEIYNYDASTCKCIKGAPFHVGVKEKSGTGNVIFNMSGGGACWPGKDSCSETADYMTGWNDSPGNPLNGWSLVHVPYCDGSIHMGDNTYNYDGEDHYFQGLKTTTAGVALMRERFPNPPKILITGCSAGGFGTFIAYMVIRRFFPDSAIYIFNDSGPGLYNPDNGMAALVDEAWLYKNNLPQSAREYDDQQLMDLYEWMLERDPKLRIGLFSSYEDATIGGSFLDMLPADFRELLISTSNAIQELYPSRFKRYLINGNTHCVGEVSGNYLYTVDGVSIVKWLEQMLNDDDGWPDILE